MLFLRALSSTNIYLYKYNNIREKMNTNKNLDFTIIQ